MLIQSLFLQCVILLLVLYNLTCCLYLLFDIQTSCLLDVRALLDSSLLLLDSVVVRFEKFIYNIDW